jgi:hypothetical protein
VSKIPNWAMPLIWIGSISVLLILFKLLKFKPF